MIYSRVSDQLVLELMDEVKGGSSKREPWNGRSPRDLTRVALGIILKPRAVKSMSDFVDPDQLMLDLWPNKAPSLWDGAPSLLPLPWEV